MMGATALDPGTVFAGKYRVIKLLGRGGVGAVYLAEQLATGARRALKLMSPGITEPRLHALFEQEARISHRVPSEHVVEVVDAGVDEGGTPWLSMEFLEGEDLGARLARDGALEPDLAETVLAQICHGLAAAHQVGIVHRDIKPENVFLARVHNVHAELAVKILDFGIARIIAERPSQSTIPIGTPAWMAPEQMTGDEAGPAVDVWALGLLAFQVLTGKSYWLTHGRQVGVVMREVMFAPLEPASARAAQLGCAGALPHGFDAWFERCVARDPRQRFPNAGEAGAAMRTFLQGTRPSLPPETRAPQPPGAAFDARWYVERPREQREAIGYAMYPGRPAVFWGPSQLGKTWLVRRCLEELRSQHGHQVIEVDPRLLDRRSIDGFLRDLAFLIASSLDIDEAETEASFGRPGTAASRITRFVERHVLARAQGPLVLAFDGVDVLQRSEFQDDVFSLLRAWAENHHEPWTRLRLVLAVSTTPGLLVRDTSRSPFNLTVPISIGELDAEQVTELARRHRLPWDEQDVGRLMALCGGHPYLVRFAMYHAALHGASLEKLLDDSRGPAWELAGEVERIRRWVEREGLLAAARAVADPSGVVDPESKHRLLRAGLVFEDGSGATRLRNRLYEIAVLGRR